MNDITLPRDVAEQVLTALEKLRGGLLKMREHAESYGHSWAMAYVKEYREMIPGASEQQFRALNVMENRLADVAEGVAQGFDAITALRDRLAQPEQQPEWYHGVDERGCNRFYHKTEVRPFDFSTPLYTAPLQSEALPRRMESEIKFHRLEEVRKAAQKIGVGYSLNYCESDDSWFFTIESVAPAEYWCGKNHSFNIAVDCVLEQLKLFENHNEKNT